MVEGGEGRRGVWGRGRGVYFTCFMRYVLQDRFYGKYIPVGTTCVAREAGRARHKVKHIQQMRRKSINSRDGVYIHTIISYE